MASSMQRVPSMEQLHSAAARPAAGARLAALSFVRPAVVRHYARARASLDGLSSYIAKPIRLGRRVASKATKHLRTSSLQRLSALSGSGSSAAVAAVLGRSDSDDQLSVDLDWRPSLSQTEEVICWSCAAAFTCLVYAITAPAVISIPYGTCMGLIFGLMLYVLRARLLEELYKARERIEADLGDPDSRFRELGNLRVHVKVKAAKTLPPPAAQNPAAARLAAPAAAAAGGGPVPAVHCYHGFGSNTWSWSLVQQDIAQRLGALVTAHDMPGFGLTQRPTDLSNYYLAFNGRLGRLALDYELAIRGLISSQEATRSGEAGYPHASVHEAAQGPAAAAAKSTQPGVVRGLEAAAGGSPQEAARRAADEGLEPRQQAAAGAAEQGDVGGVLRAGTSSSGSGSGATTSTTSSGGSSGSSSSSAGGRAKRVLMGHSLGGACAALEFIANPRDYAAVVLVDPAIIAPVGGPAEQDRPEHPVKLERLQDGTLLTRTLASAADAGDDAAEAAAAAAAEAAAAEAAAAKAAAAKAAAAGGGSSSGSASSSASEDLDALAAQQGTLTRSSSSSGGAAGGGSGSDSDASLAGVAATAAAGDVALYATRGDAATFAKLLKASDPSSANAAVKLLTNAIGLVRGFVLLTTLVALSLLRPLIVLLLRVAVRSRKFWANTLEQAYYDKSKVTAQAVDAYRLPQLVRGWEAGMVQFLLARLGAGGARAATAAAGAAPGGAAPPGGLEDANLAGRFAAAVAAAGTPVLIVHGGGDKLIPVSNSFKLARLIRGCRLAVVKRAGHCPQEEVPGLFQDVVCGFLGRKLAG